MHCNEGSYAIYHSGLLEPDLDILHNVGMFQQDLPSRPTYQHLQLCKAVLRLRTQQSQHLQNFCSVPTLQLDHLAGMFRSRLASAYCVEPYWKL